MQQVTKISERCLIFEIKYPRAESEDFHSSYPRPIQMIKVYVKVPKNINFVIYFK